MQDMETARQQAESATRSKSEFLANMSHEIRTPMTAILGYTELLMDPSHEKDQFHSAVQTIQQNGEHLLTIINDVVGRFELFILDDQCTGITGHPE